MQIVYQDGAGTSEVELRLGRPDAAVADLAAALAAPTADLVVDGRAVSARTPLALAGLLVGVSVRPAGSEGRPAQPRRAVVRVVGGLFAGTSVAVSVGTATVGRDPDATVVLDDPAVSRAHCRLEVLPNGRVVVSDLWSRNGTDVNGVRVDAPTPVAPDDLICVGGIALLRVLPTEHLDAAFGCDPGRSATVPFSRAPRSAVPAPAPPVPVPVKPADSSAPTFNIAMVAGSAALATAGVLTTHRLGYLAVAALGPLVMVANWVEGRTRGRRSVRRQLRRFDAVLAIAAQRLADRHAAEIRLRRELMVDPAEALYRVRAPSVRLWERRPAAEDFMVLSVGVADLDWAPPVTGATDDPAPEVAAVLDPVRRLPIVPVTVRLRAGTVLGLDGNRSAALAMARSLVAQAVSTAGPADLIVAVFTDAGRVADWDWVKWLPQVADRRGGSARLLAAGAADCAALATDLLEAGGKGPLLLAVVDGAALLEGRPCVPRDLLAGRPVAALVLADRLPALCTDTVTVASDGLATLRRLTTAETVPGVLATGMAQPAARELARGLARFEDPELQVAAAGLPDTVALLSLLGLPDLDAPTLLARWRQGAASLRAGAVLGVTGQGLFEIDLDDDGPHGLIAGTTGSGKSELLRTLVASLAIGNDPDHLTFALVDYKGGGALDECARLPHSVGLVTDLDEQLGARALRCLEAELRHRERLLRRAGLNHVRDYQRWRDSEPGAEPMPRLVVVIDEFATLVKALPDFVDSLVGIAQRGRSLGMHLILATQRPAGSVSDGIKNNTKLRIALRLESTSDSVDVIDSPVAAEIGGRQWGRAFHRVSAREVRPVQTALSTAVSGDGAGQAVTVRPFRFGRDGGDASRPAPPGAETDLQRLVAAARAAFDLSGLRPPRRPWPAPLPPRVDQLPALAERGVQSATTGLPSIALADDPERQARYPVGWDPEAGNLLLYGVGGAGTSTALTTLALAWAGLRAPHDLHLYVLDLGAGELAALAGLPHTGAYIGAGQRERQVRLIRLLRGELADRKRAGRSERPSWLVLLDNIAALVADLDRDLPGMNLLEDLARVYSDGPAVGIHLAVSADRSGSVPHQWGALTQQKLLFRLADPAEYSLFDVPRNRVPTFVPGRAVVAATGQTVQVRWPGADLPAAVAAVASGWPATGRRPAQVRVLPARVALPALPVTAHTSTYPWKLPIGLRHDTLAPLELWLYEHEHALIAGPARSGRSTALCTLAAALAGADRPPALMALTSRASPLRDLPGLAAVLDDPAGLAAALPDGPAVLLVDDADQVADPDGELDRLLERRRTGLHVVAAGRADNLRRCYGHWTQQVRASRCGVLLAPDHDLDGDLLSVDLPRLDRLAPLPGRGYLAMNGAVTGLQLALPDPAAQAAEEYA